MQLIIYASLASQRHSSHYATIFAHGNSASCLFWGSKNHSLLAGGGERGGEKTNKLSQLRYA